MRRTVFAAYNSLDCRFCPKHCTSSNQFGNFAKLKKAKRKIAKNSELTTFKVPNVLRLVLEFETQNELRDV